MAYADSRNKRILNTKQEAGDSSWKRTEGDFRPKVFLFPPEKRSPFWLKNWEILP